jgi:hypothetical protein
MRKVAAPYSFLLSALLATTLASCAKPAGEVSQPAASSSQTMVRGTIAEVSDGEVTVKTATGDVSVTLTKAFQLFARAPSDLAHVKDSSFVGVTSVKQPNGAEKATEIHIFPEELRGMGEGSHMMSDATPSRMTNGSVSEPRMSNGSVKHTGGSTIQVKYQGGVQTITVPPGVAVTEIKPSQAKLSTGDKVVLQAQKDSNGSLSSSRAILSGK